MTAKIYKEWLIDMIPQFKATAGERPITLVIDNAPYHNSTEDAVPTISSKKQKIIDFLEKQCIPIEAGMTKKELIDVTNELVNLNPDKFNKKEVDEICKKAGIEVS